MKLPVRTLVALASVTLCGGFLSGIARAEQGSESPHATSHRKGEKGEERGRESGSHGKKADIIADALSQVELRPDQRDLVQRIGDELQAHSQDVKSAKEDLKDAMAQQLASGKPIDADALQPQVDKLVQAHLAANPDMRKAFDDLHRTLDKDQREKFADALEKRMDEARKAHKSSDVADEIAQRLSLTDQQKDQVKSVLDRAEDESKADRETHDKMLKAFREDNFDSRQVLSDKDAEKMTRDRTERMIEAARDISAILTPQQRIEAARMLREKGEEGQSGRHSETGHQGSQHGQQGSERGQRGAHRGGQQGAVQGGQQQGRR